MGLNESLADSTSTVNVQGKGQGEGGNEEAQ